MTLQMPITRRHLRALLEPWRSKRDLLALSLFAFDCLGFTISEAIAVLARPFVLRTGAAIITSLFISRLFILAHDACHGSLLTKAWLNRWVGRIGFLPSLTPYSLWEAGHNVVHHGFTNLKGRDWVWTPLSKSEYESLSPTGRLLQRIYRTPAGLGLYYALELWWNRMIVPEKAYLPAKRSIYRKDQALVIFFALIHTFALILIARSTGQSTASVLSFGLILPFLCWTQTMGLVIYQHHTHPAVAWFDKRAEWNVHQVQLRNAIHIIFPCPLNVLLHNIMEHTAHHVDIGVPLHNLGGAQTLLEETFPDDVLIQPWNLNFFMNCLNTCKLYDYDSHCWLDFEGNVTSNVKVVRQPKTEAGNNAL